MPDTLRNILSFLVVLPIIIVVHEAGHLLVAKLFRMRVLAFSVGFGKPFWTITRGGTEYRLSSIPLGGYVKLSGEVPDEASDDPSDFLNRARWQRILVYLAGPAANIVLSIVVVALVFTAGIQIPKLSSDEKPVIGAVEPGSSAAQAGLKSGDVITAVKGHSVDNWGDVQIDLIGSPNQVVPLRIARGEKTVETQVTPRKMEGQEGGDLGGMFPLLRPQIIDVLGGQPAQKAGFRSGDDIRRVAGKPIVDTQSFVDEISARPGQTVPVDILRDNKPLTLTVTPVADPSDGKGRVGVHVGYYQRYSFGPAIVESVKFNVQTVRQTIQVLGKLLTRELSPKTALAGPIEMAKQSGEAAKLGGKHLAFFMAFLSLSIAVMNLMPIPILDGGNIFILLIESAIRRNLSMRLREVINSVGFVMILLLMGMVLWLDVGKQFVR